MGLTPDQEKKLLALLLGILILAAGYRLVSPERQKTQPLTYTQGMKVSSPVREGISAPGEAVDPLAAFLTRQREAFPGVSRDIFRMVNPAPPKPKEAPKPVMPVTAPTPTVPEKTPQEIAAESARADLSRFRFLGYLTDKDSSLFLSKDGELFIVKSGDTVLKNYQVKSAGKDFVVLFDTATNVEVRVELTGSGDAAPQRHR